MTTYLTGGSDVSKSSLANLETHQLRDFVIRMYGHCVKMMTSYLARAWWDNIIMVCSLQKGCFLYIFILG